MYILTFVILIVSVLGAYTQVYAVNTARLFSHQVALAETMLTWHGEAVRTAHSIDNASLTPNGCGLTAGMPAPCTASIALPAGYAMAYAWKSLAFESGGTAYVITYADTSTGSAASLTRTAYTQLGTPLIDLYREIRDLNLPS